MTDFSFIKEALYVFSFSLADDLKLFSVLIGYAMISRTWMFWT